MAVFWVQHYYTLPVIFENIGMGDEFPPRPNITMNDGEINQSRGLRFSPAC